MNANQKENIENFTRFFNDKKYIKLKNYLFNYLNRRRLIKLYSKKYLNNNNILDIGCGISPVTPNPKDTLFVDISRPALGVLRENGYKTIYGSITEIPLDENSTNILFCSEVLEHIEDYNKALEEISRVLSKDGLAFITVPCWQKFWDIDDDFVGHYRRFDPSEFQKDIEKQGLKLIEKKTIGSKLERKLTTLLVKQFKKNKESKTPPLPLYITANYTLSWLITLSKFLSKEEDSSIILFIYRRLQFLN